MSLAVLDDIIEASGLPEREFLLEPTFRTSSCNMRRFPIGGKKWLNQQHKSPMVFNINT
ncbi:MAG: hypothetical protein V7K32_18955 [Nostoc sp.]|uniref:hypothetical protein n=1 Tax=Nostoc sp. TaxID=1180 RepID=UPI002FF82CA9